MIATLAKIKELLQITDSNSDALITTLIEQVTDYVFNNVNKFANGYVFLQSCNISFNKTANTITHSTGVFLTDGFTAGLVFYVAGSKYNDGIYTIAEVTETTITVTGSIEYDESADEYITIQAIQYPKSIITAVAEYIKLKMDKGRFVKSEKLGDYSVTNFDMNQAEDLFKPWHNPYNF